MICQKTWPLVRGVGAGGGWGGGCEKNLVVRNHRTDFNITSQRYFLGDPLPRLFKKGKRKVQGVPQSQTAALPRPQEEEETDKSKQTEQTYEKHQD